MTETPFLAVLRSRYYHLLDAVVLPARLANEKRFITLEDAVLHMLGRKYAKAAGDMYRRATWV